MIKHEFTREAVCPYCGCEESDSWELEDGGEYECGECDGIYTVQRIVTVEYSTHKVLAPNDVHNIPDGDYVMADGNVVGI